MAISPTALSLMNPVTRRLLSKYGSGTVKPTSPKSEKKGAEKRKRPRITLEELKSRGVDVVKEKRPDIEKTPDRRSTLIKVMDWIDLPRNLVGRVVGGIAGVEMKDREEGALGVKKVFMSDVLEKLGVKNKVVKGVVGFAGDVAIDPLTYMTAGASTGKALSRITPKVLKSGTKLIKRASLGLSDEIAGAIGLKVFKAASKKYGKNPKAFRHVLEKIIARNVTKSGPVGDASRLFFKTHGLKGRPLFRIPFTEKFTGVMGFGKAARKYKAITDPGLREGLAKLGKFKQVVHGVRKAAGMRHKSAKAAVEARKAGKDVPTWVKNLKGKRKAVTGETRALAETLDIARSQGKKLTMSQIKNMAKSEILGATRTGPDLLKLAHEAKWGKALDPNSPFLPLARAFGWGQKGSMRQRELGAQFRATFGKNAVARNAFQKTSKVGDAIAEKYAKQGIGSFDEVRGMIFDLADLSDEAGNLRKTFHPSDFGSSRVFQVLKNTGLDKQDDVMAFIKQYRDDAVKFGKDPKTIHRMLTREARKHVSRMEKTVGRSGAKAADTFSKSVDQPFDLGRTKRLEYTVPTTGEKVTVLSTETDKIQDLARQGVNTKTPDNIYDISRAEMNKMAARGELKALGGKELHEAMAAGKKVVPQSEYGKLSPEAFQFQEADLASSAATRAGQFEAQQAAKDVGRMVNDLGVVVDPAIMRQGDLVQKGLQIPQMLPETHPLRQTPLGKIFPGAGGPQVAYPREVAEMLNRYGSMWTAGSDDLNSLLRATDYTLKWGKRWMLFHPAYVIRNGWQNMFGHLMNGGNPLSQARWSMNKQVSTIRKAVQEGTENSLRGQMIKIGPRSYDMGDIAHGLRLRNIEGASKTGAEITHTALRGPGRVRGVGRRAVGGADAFANLVQTQNSKMEVNMKIGSIFDFMAKGMGLDDAVQKSLLSMPDMADITRFEKTYMTRLFPWYRWLKANGANQLLHHLPNSPIWPTIPGKLKRLIETSMVGKPVDEKLRPEWMKEMQAAQFMGDEKGGSAALLRTWFPFEEIPAGLSLPVSPHESAQWLASSLRPGLKAGVEFATGTDVFRQRPVEQKSTTGYLKDIGKGKPFLGSSGTALDNFLAIRPLREYAKRVPEQEGLAGKLSRGFLGGTVQPVNAEKGAVDLDWQTRKEMGTIRSKFVRAMENRDSDAVQSLFRQYMQLVNYRRELGLGASKDNAEILAEMGIGNARR